MVDKTTRSIVVEAPAAEVMAVIADFPQYPAWVAAVSRIEVLEPGRHGRARKVRFVLSAGVVKDDYDLVYDWSPDGLSVSWDLVRGELQRYQHGSYTLQPQPDGTTCVVYELTVDLTLPMIGMIKRKAEKVITDTALKELKKRVEG